MTWKELRNAINEMDDSQLENEAKFLKGSTLVTISFDKAKEDHYCNSEWGEYTVPENEMDKESIEEENTRRCIEEGEFYLWEK
ncbi:hypothetical protein [Bacteroides nordii]|uniref:hypothetical protein n=1 Tax=Bacteroides nordii TaxID=291645 RepID=UPI002A8027E5|nr:hypothetical protein [Bacteroides nordii]